MYTFRFSRPMWHGLCIDTRLMWGKGQQGGCLQVTDVDGQSLVFTHASATGVLCEHPGFIRALKPDVVICCYPRLAKRLYPDLPILGNWLVKTHVHGGKDCVLYIEEDTRETVPGSTAS